MSTPQKTLCLRPCLRGQPQGRRLVVQQPHDVQSRRLVVFSVRLRDLAHDGEAIQDGVVQVADDEGHRHRTLVFGTWLYSTRRIPDWIR